ncbi:PREDICTED: aquaporin-like [Nicrophorus vespilloides]|uniref:Aquaporin-like n=1 Tax=Nicrophorus vespilloides TaxID=110193 RepID=A0ABM1N0M9_NICVS|nr:PREDICTED: aquaporin-like [Nicrophorus vespilloides]
MKFNLNILKYGNVFLSEFFGTAILLFISCFGSLPNKEFSGHFNACITSGLAVMSVMQIFGHISGAHVNPVTTICACIMGQVDVLQAVIYFVAQMWGSLAGFGLLLIIFPEAHSTFGMTLPLETMKTWKVFIIEVLITFVLSIANCSTWDPRVGKLKDSMPLRIGFLVIALNLIAAPYTGCSMNPARSFGPALWNNQWHIHWVYWLAPISAGVLAAIIYKFAFNVNSGDE